MSLKVAVESPPINGILNIDKPYGITSMDVVRRVKRASGVKRVGHGGTLDPIATGVIPICIGQATRMMEYLIEGGKLYHGVIELGVVTDTYDALGEVTETSDTTDVTIADVERALGGFVGDIKQVPPMYSALKQQGKRLYNLARAGIEVEREARNVRVDHIRVLEWDPPNVNIEVACGRGFYMRSLAYDLGLALGCGGHLKSLRRMKNGRFEVASALPLDEAEEILSTSNWKHALYTPDAVLEHLSAFIAGKRAKELLLNGRSVRFKSGAGYSGGDLKCRVYDTDGRFFAIIKFDADNCEWHPEKVFQFESNGQIPTS